MGFRDSQRHPAPPPSGRGNHWREDPKIAGDQSQGCIQVSQLQNPVSVLTAKGDVGRQSTENTATPASHHIKGYFDGFHQEFRGNAFQNGSMETRKMFFVYFPLHFWLNSFLWDHKFSLAAESRFKVK
jgi:hypothetical protein